MPLPTTYVDATTLKATLELAGSTFVDTDVASAVSAASSWIDQACGRTFGKDATTDVARKFIPINAGYVLIDDLCTFTSLTDESGNTWTKDVDFYLEPINAAADGWPYTAIRTIARPFLYPLSSMSAGWQSFDSRITVTGQWGWSSVPAPIVEATTILAGRLLSRARSPLGVIGMGIDGVGVRVPRVDPDVQALIAPYQRAFIA